MPLHTVKWLRFFAYLLICLILPLASCGEESEIELLAHVDENDLIQVMGILKDEGIESTKVANPVEEGKEKPNFKVLIKPQDKDLAIRLLQESNLPSQNRGEVKEPCGAEPSFGGSSDPYYIRCKLKLGKQSEIERQLLQINGITSAKVILAGLDTPPRPGAEDKVTASVTITTHLRDEGQLVTENNIKQLVSKSVENLDARNVGVTIIPPRKYKKTYTDLKPTATLVYEEIVGLKIAPDTKSKLKTYAIVSLSLVLILALGLVLTLLKLLKTRKLLQTESGPESSTALVPQQDGSLSSAEEGNKNSGT